MSNIGILVDTSEHPSIESDKNTRLPTCRMFLAVHEGKSI